MKCIPFLLSLLLLAGCGTIRSWNRTYKDLGNPTNFVFDSDSSTVNEALKKVENIRLNDVAVTSPIPGGGVRIRVFPHYSSNYWKGRQEDLVYPAEAGKIGQISAAFRVNVIPQGDKTMVSVNVINFQQQIGRRYAINPHFRKTPVRADVKSDTFFEYLFLRKLGQVLGQPNMPPLTESSKGLEARTSHIK